MTPPDEATGVSGAELLAALSLAIDLGLGQPMEHVLRSCALALGLADIAGLDEAIGRRPSTSRFWPGSAVAPTRTRSHAGSATTSPFAPTVTEST